MKNRRILEITDSRGNTGFYPQHKFLWWWCCWEGYWGKISFLSLDAAREWVNYRSRKTVIVHEVEPE